MQSVQLLTVIISCSATAAAISIVGQIIMWKLNRKAKKEDEETEYQKHIKNAVCVILYDRIKYLGRIYIGDGEISVEDLGDLMKMHTVYHDDLEGNGFLDNLMRQVKALPIKR